MLGVTDNNSCNLLTESAIPVVIAIVISSFAHIIIAGNKTLCLLEI